MRTIPIEALYAASTEDQLYEKRTCKKCTLVEHMTNVTNDVWHEIITIIADTAKAVIYRLYGDLKNKDKVHRRLLSYADNYDRSKNNAIGKYALIVYVIARMAKDRIKYKICGELEDNIVSEFNSRFFPYIIDSILSDPKKKQELLNFFVLEYIRLRDLKDRNTVS